MWTDILPDEEYAIKYLKALNAKEVYPYNAIAYRVSSRLIGNELCWGIYNPSISCYEFVWIPNDIGDKI